MSLEAALVLLYTPPMQTQRQPLWHRGAHGFLALWLGLVLPLLCVPGISSNHTHGIHWVWETMDVKMEATAPNHGHNHAQSHAHEHSVASTAPSVRSGAASTTPLRTNQTPQSEELLNVFGLMETTPSALPIWVVAGLVLLLGLGNLFRAVPPLATPWNPPKAFS